MSAGKPGKFMAECLDAELPSSDDDEDDCDAHDDAIGMDAAVSTAGVAALASLAADAFSEDAEEAVRIVALEAIGAICDDDEAETELTEVCVRSLNLRGSVSRASIHSNTLVFHNSRENRLRFHVLVAP
jgi:hypothetical protein